MPLNPFLAPFLSRLENRFSVDSISMSMTDWVCANTTLRGKPFSIEGYEFQRAILDDMHPNLDVIKCSQVGLTEIEIRKVLAFLNRNRGVTAIFTLPNEEMYKRISQTRIKPLIEKDRVFNGERDEKATRSMILMQFADSFLHVNNCSEGAATSTSADFVANDEVDLSDQAMLALFNSRLQNSDYKISQRFSTPSFPSYGIDLSYKSSDQRVYMIKCSACNHWQWPEFNLNFIEIPGLPSYVEKLTELDPSMELALDQSYVKCEKCSAALQTGVGEWVARYPGRTHARGYHISPFSTSRLSAAYIIAQLFKYKERENLRGFHNTVLGLPYSDGTIQIDRSAIEACFTTQVSIPDVSKDIWLGIDMGQTCHITAVTPDMQVVMFKQVHVDNLIATVKEIPGVIGGAVDRHPYEPTAQELFEVTSKKIVPVEYRGTKEVNLIYDTFKVLTHAQADRTMLLDKVASVIRRSKIKFSGYGHYKETIIEHLRDMVRDETPETPAVWKKLTGQDHFFHSLGLALFSMRVQDAIRAAAEPGPGSMYQFYLPSMEARTPVLFGRSNKPLENTSLL